MIRAEYRPSAAIVQTCASYKRARPVCKKPVRMKIASPAIADDDDDEITHGRFFGENITRAIHALRGSNGRP